MRFTLVDYSPTFGFVLLQLTHLLATTAKPPQKFGLVLVGSLIKIKGKLMNGLPSSKCPFVFSCGRVYNVTVHPAVIVVTCVEDVVKAMQ